MQRDAFKVLGIEPTTDGHAIRAAFLRLARIYHPDRFVDMPEDVRAEAERRMKEATVAYEELRNSRRASAQGAEQAATTRFGNDLWERAKRARDAVDALRLENERSRTRWLLWEELERQARDRAEWEARMAAQLTKDDDPSAWDRTSKPEADDTDARPSELVKRLEEARQGRRNALARAANRTA